MKILGTILALLAFTFSTSTFATDAKALPNCVQCHGTNLKGNPALMAPNLAILPQWYIRAQIASYQQGWRSNNVEQTFAKDMEAVAKSLSAEDINVALAFINTVAKTIPRQTIQGDVAKGKVLYLQCAACHGDNAQGNQNLAAPPLAGQTDWYLAKQLHAYKNANRGFSAEDKSGQLMLNSIAMLPTAADVDNVVAYIQSIHP
ncbi:c-type cytochrome [Alteromonadaceae bacterium BrNp21-10]|nr:c-type cytochrome [Alteromonadaceae bacterium BrNp21-10]